MFRCFLIFASVFFILGAILIGFVWIDVVIYNTIMIIINVFYLIPLIKPFIDIDLNQIEQGVYDNVFSKSIDKRTCKRLLDSAKFFPIGDQNFITQQGSIYTGVYLVGYMKPDYQLVFVENEQEVFKDSKAYTWMGLIEYDMMRKAKKKGELFKWPISIFLDKKKTGVKKIDDEIDVDYPEPLYVYFFEFEQLQEIYAGENGTFVRNALHSVWLEAICHKILDIDIKVSKFLESREKMEKNAEDIRNNENEIKSKNSEEKDNNNEINDINKINNINSSDGKENNINSKENENSKLIEKQNTIDSDELNAMQL